MLPQKRSKSGLVISIIVCLFLVFCSTLIVLSRQRIIDQITVWKFNPSSEIANIASRDKMSSYGKFLFYASQPELNSTQTFNSVCNRIENTTSILGCYSNSRIYIYDVTDENLDGVREVTSAHETLHAAYARMSSSDKLKINKLLEAEYKKLENNKSFTDLIAFYDRTEPGERDNELHSVIGTEISKLDPVLETYYKQYFDNRQDVVALYYKYNGVFQSLSDRAKTLSDQLNLLAESITSDSTQYNEGVQVLNVDIEQFNKRATIGDFTSQAQFNSERAVLSSRVDSSDSMRASINDEINKYNLILTEYNSIASQSKKLYNSINSTLAPAPSV